MVMSPQLQKNRAATLASRFTGWIGVVPFFLSDGHSFGEYAPLWGNSTWNKASKLPCSRPEHGSKTWSKTHDSLVWKAPGWHNFKVIWGWSWMTLLILRRSETSRGSAGCYCLSMAFWSCSWDELNRPFRKMGSPMSVKQSVIDI